MKLHYRSFGQPRDDRPSLLLVHGLFGSVANWQGVARRLQDDYHLIAVDQRNHGGSPHAEVMTYQAMAGDLQAFIDQHALQRPLLVGHSMGGKAGMWLALNHPELLRALVVVDISPVHYVHSFNPMFDALLRLDLSSLRDRRHADELLAPDIPSAAVRAYLLQNLVKQENGWQWRINLQVLARSMDYITDFPDKPVDPCPLPVLFIRGEKSDYVHKRYWPTIRDYFPHSDVHTIDGAGHWVYSEQPDLFCACLRQFLDEL